jgi:hypothetical protein
LHREWIFVPGGAGRGGGAAGTPAGAQKIFSINKNRPPLCGHFSFALENMGVVRYESGSQFYHD